MNRILQLLLVLLFISVIANLQCEDSSSSSNPNGNTISSALSADYEQKVSEVAPNVQTVSGSLAENKIVNKAECSLTDTGVMNSADTTLDAIKNDSVFFTQWVGWDNENNGALSAAAPDGWMPFRENPDGSYIDLMVNDSYPEKQGSDCIPDLKDYAVLNKVFFGSGSSTIYGSAKMLDSIIINLNSMQVFEDTAKPEMIYIPSWFGPVYIDEQTSSSKVHVDNLIKITDDNSGEMQIAYSVNKESGEQAVTIYQKSMQGSTYQISMFYGRRDSQNSLYIKSSFIDFDENNNWASSHITEIRTKGNDFIIRKANKILGNGDACCPDGTIYSHALIGGGSIANDSFFLLRWYEGRYLTAGYSSDNQPDLAAMREVGQDKPLASSIYFIIQYDDTAKFNKKFIPLYAKGSGGGAIEALPVSLTSDEGASTYFNQKPEIDNYSTATEFFTQSELPGWENDTVDTFTSLTIIQ